MRKVRVMYRNGKVYCFVACAPTVRDFECMIHDISVSYDVESIGYTEVF